MDKIKKGDKFGIHSYKHDGHIHRSWDEAIYIGESNNVYIFGNNKTKVVEADGRKRTTGEGAIIYFFKNNWFNIIGQIKPDGIYYYCNLASPFIIEDGIIKYIDYDLDVRVFPNGSFRILDKREYEYHKYKMNYSEDLDKVLKYELNTLINMIRNKKGPFERDKIRELYSIYEEFTIKK
jgi:protein associated with RNAse G/E